jgi:hypothetical protein
MAVHALVDEPLGEVAPLDDASPIVEDVLRTRVGVAAVALLGALAVHAVGWVRAPAGLGVLRRLLLVVVEPRAASRVRMHPAPQPPWHDTSAQSACVEQSVLTC